MTQAKPLQPTKSAAALYFGKVMHARMKPKAHRFSYNIFSVLMNVDELKQADSLSPLFSVNTWNILSFKERDHGNKDGSNLRGYVESLMRQGNLPIPDKIRLWCNPRVLGYVFNPISIYYCYDENGEIYCLIYQVHNTFGQSHSYVAPVNQNDAHGSIRQTAGKLFYVSPFLEMDMRYQFRISPPDHKTQG